MLKPSTGSVASAFLAKLGGSAAASTGSGVASSVLSSTVKAGPLPLSKQWAFRRPPAQKLPELGMEYNRDLVLTRIVPNSPADDAHVCSGWIVATVNDKPVSSEVELKLRVEQSSECTILFFEGDAVSEVLRDVMNAPYGADGHPDEPDLAALHASNPSRFGFLAADHPLHGHWTSRVASTRAARDALRALEEDDEAEARRAEAAKQRTLQSAMANLDDLLASGDDEDAPPANGGAAPGPQPGGAAPPLAVPLRPMGTAEQLQAAQPAARQARSMFAIDDGEDDASGDGSHSGAPPAAQPPVASPSPDLDILRAAILGAMTSPSPPAPVEPASAVAPEAAPRLPIHVPLDPRAGLLPLPSGHLSQGDLPVFSAPQPTKEKAGAADAIIRLDAPKPAPPPGRPPPEVYERLREERRREEDVAVPKAHRGLPGLCINFDRGTCRRGAGCRYLHRAPDGGDDRAPAFQPPVAFQPPPGMRRGVCNDYLAGSCDRVVCRFAHVSAADLGGAPPARRHPRSEQQRDDRDDNAAYQRPRERDSWSDGERRRSPARDDEHGGRDGDRRRRPSPRERRGGDRDDDRVDDWRRSHWDDARWTDQRRDEDRREARRTVGRTPPPSADVAGEPLRSRRSPGRHHGRR